MMIPRLRQTVIATLCHAAASLLSFPEGTGVGIEDNFAFDSRPDGTAAWRVDLQTATGECQMYILVRCALVHIPDTGAM